MHWREFAGNVKNYNGKGRWDVAAVQARYREYCDQFQIEKPLSLVPIEHREGEVVWIFPIMDEVIKGITSGDAACIELGVEFVEEDALFPLGLRLKATTARELRRALLSETQKARLRKRITAMLAIGLIPHEMREYVKLLRKIGVGEYWPLLEREVPRDNPYAMRFYKSLREAEGLTV
jgi:hypothetical protein